MMVRRILSLVLTAQLLLTQLMACHCDAGCGATPHIHLGPAPETVDAGYEHRHDPHDDHGTGADAGHRGDEGPACPEHRHGDEADVHPLPDGWHGPRDSARPLGAAPALALLPADRLDLRDLLAGVRQSTGVPPDPRAPRLPLYLRDLRLLV